MIKTENDYLECLKQLQKDQEYLVAQRQALEEAGLKQEEIHRALQPSSSFNQQLIEEVECYERVTLKQQV